MVSLKLSQPELFGPLQLEDPAAGTVGTWPVQVTVGLVWETVPLEGVAANEEFASRITVNPSRNANLSAVRAIAASSRILTHPHASLRQKPKSLPELGLI